jgi:hypothetical protein
VVPPFAFPAPLTVLWLGATALLIVLAGLGVGRKITWYLAVDQYGYLAFAHDLARGHVFHHWPPLDALASRLPPQVDVLSQTYIYDHGRLYCRYAPGFAILLAGWLLLFGDDGAHYLNPTVYVTLLVLLLVFQRRVFHSRWRATAGVALVVLFPTYMHLWGTTLTRDLSTHLAALFGLFLLLPTHGRRLGAARTAAAGVALGYAGSIRPDAVLYVVPALLMAAARWKREQVGWRAVLRMLATGALGLGLGLLPFLAYNWVATGNPLRPTQGMEVQLFQPAAAPPPVAPPPEPTPRVGYPPGAWHGGTIQAVQGGGLKLQNLPNVLPGNLQLLRAAYGPVFLGMALWGALVAFVRRRTLFFAVVPYLLLAVFLYSCWSRPDGRYLSGVHCLLPMLVVEGLFGTLDLVRGLSRRRALHARWLALAGAVALVAAVALVRVPSQNSALPTLSVLLPLAGAAAALAAAAWPRRRIAGLLVPLVALTLVGLVAYRSQASLSSRGAFQRPQMLRARATFARAVQPHAAVITTEDVGRPAENIDYYSGVAYALYLTDLERWRLAPSDAADLLLDAGMVPYLFIPPALPGHAELLRGLASHKLELVAKVPAGQAMDYFVAAPFHTGVPMELWRITRQPG